MQQASGLVVPGHGTAWRSSSDRSTRASAITVDNAPVRVATAWLLFLTVRRCSGAAPACWRAILALTPVVTLMFRSNNADALPTRC